MALTIRRSDTGGVVTGGSTITVYLGSPIELTAVSSTGAEISWFAPAGNDSIFTFAEGTGEYVYTDTVTLVPQAAGTGSYAVQCREGYSITRFYVTVASSKPISVTGISVAPASTELLVSGTCTVTATVTPTNATDTTVYWSSDDTTVATVSSSSGKSVTVTGRGAGTATITGRTKDGGYTDTCIVTVKRPATDIAVTDVVVSKSTLDLEAGETYTLTATVYPTNATNKNVTWSSSNSSVATVGSSTGLVTAKGKGTATITARTSDGGYTDTCVVTVTVGVESITISPTNLTLNVGETRQLTITIRYSDGSTSTTPYLCSTTNSSVAGVSSSGLITANGVGTATIRVYADSNYSNSTTCTVTVKEVIHVTGVTCSESLLILAVGEKHTLYATVSPSDADDKTVTWSSSNTSVATIGSSTGAIVAKGAGTATVTVTTNDGGLTATCRITVVGVSLTFAGGSTGSSVTIDVNSILGIQATVLPSSLSDTSVVFELEQDDGTLTTFGMNEGGTYDSDNFMNVTALQGGTATLKAYSCYHSAAYAELTIIVEGALITSIDLGASPRYEPCRFSGDEIAVVTPTILPKNASNTRLAWSITDGDSSIIQILESPAKTCSLNCLHVGDVVLRGAAQDGSGVYAEITISIKPGAYIWKDGSLTPAHGVILSSTLEDVEYASIFPYG